jgi:imidazolonepropionase-like amidohydrolase
MRNLRLLLIVVCALFAAPLFAATDEATDLAAARALFDKNLDAIRHRDRPAYLELYVHSDHLARVGATGFQTGFDDFAKQRDVRWPDTFDASDLHLVRVAPGIVYATYRYRVRYGNEEHTGISERVFLKTPAGWRIGVTGAIDAPAGTPPPPRAIVGATLVDGRGGPPIANANVILRDGKIDCAGDCAVPAGVATIDGHGLWVTPGLVDAHVHFAQTGWADGRPDFLDVRATHPYAKVEADLKANPQRYAKSYICSGVTAVFDVGGFPWTLQLADRFANDTLAPHIAAAGPLLSPFIPQQLLLPAEQEFISIKDEAAARAAVDYNAAQGSKAIKIWYIVRPPDLPVEASEKAVMAAGDEAAKLGLPLIVHSTGLAEAKVALRAGAKVLVHSVEDLPVDDEFLALAKKNGTILIPTLTVIQNVGKLFHAGADKKMPPVDDPNHCVDKSTMAKLAETASVADIPADRLGRVDKRISDTLAAANPNLMKLVAAGIPIATGTDAGNPLTLHGPAIYAEMDAMQSAGMTPMQVIVASTATAARAMGLDAVAGTIEKGKDADLVIVGADPTKDVANFRKVRYVVRAGVVRNIEELSAMAQ